MTIRIQKTNGTYPVDITISNEKYGVTIRGEVYPFVRRFHSADFSVSKAPFDQGGMEAVVGTGGNKFPLEQSMRMVDALRIAHDHASYYKELCESLMVKRDYDRVMSDLMALGSDEALIDALVLTPRDTPVESIEAMLKKLNRGRRLGLADGLRKSMTDDFFDQQGGAIDGLLALCFAHPDFKIEDGDYAKAMDELFCQLEQAGKL